MTVMLACRVINYYALDVKNKKKGGPVQLQQLHAGDALTEKVPRRHGGGGQSSK
jgi:hypothetical protein